LYFETMKTRQKIALGSVLASMGAAGIALSSLLGWASLDRPWGFLLGFLLGMAAGAGTVLVIAGLLEIRRLDKQDTPTIPQ
jgi:hypothetical protein